MERRRTGGRPGRGDRARPADALSGRILHVGDDLAELAERCPVDQDLRRLRLRWDRTGQRLTAAPLRGPHRRRSCRELDYRSGRFDMTGTWPVLRFDGMERW